MADTSQLDAFAARLGKDVDYKTKHSVFSELLDLIETFNGANEYEYFLKSLMPIFIDQLESVPVSFISSSNEHKLRNSVLEIVHRMAMNDTFQPYAAQLLQVLQKILVDENEENGVLCMKIITSLHKSYKEHLNDSVQPFIDIINEIYKHMDKLVRDTFNGDVTVKTLDTETNETSPARPSSPSMVGGDDSQPKTLNKSMYSFKTLAECPITMVSLYSSYKNLVQQTLPQFVPNIINILSLEVDDQKSWRLEVANKTKQANSENANELPTVSPHIKNRTAYGEFILGQVKAASFLAYAFIRGYASSYLKEYNSDIPDLILRLLHDCPSELSAARKELLHATRHILSTNFRTMFIPKIDQLFDEKVLIGDGLTSHDTLRPLAYSTVADFIHNVRNELTPEQVWKTVKIYCDLLKDDTLALTVQIMSAKLLLNLVERIMKLPNKSEGRQLFMIIIESYATRFFSLNRQYAHIIKKHEEFEKKRLEKEKEMKKLVDAYGGSNGTLDDNKTSSVVIASSDADGDVEMDGQDKKEVLPDISIFNISDFSPIQITASSGSDPLKDARYLFRTLMTFLKSVIFGLKNCNPPPTHEAGVNGNGIAANGANSANGNNAATTAAKWNDSARIFSFEEINILRELFREGINCLRFFSSSKPKPIINERQTFDISGPNLPITSSKEEKDIMEIFATIFIHIDPATFNEIVSFELGFMYSSMLSNAALLHIPQFFLASETTSANFSGLLISFLKGKLGELGEVDIVKSNILIRLFKLCFMSVNLFPTANESVILPHLNELILNSLKLSTTAEEPIVYFYLIRTLFRSIGGGRFENLYKEIMPLLQVLLETLNRMIQTARRPQERDIYVELCLTVPVRLSVLVPHLSYLMRPLVFALNGSQELVSQGLRTLELCVDNLTAEYFDPIIEPVIEEVMAALWKHLRPLPYYHQHSHTTFRILGKLGGRNRKFIKPPSNLQTQDCLDQEIEALVSIHGLGNEGNSIVGNIGGVGKVPVSITPGVQSALTLLEDPRLKSHYRVSAFKYLTGILKLFIDSGKQVDVEVVEQQIKKCVSFLMEDYSEERKEDEGTESSSVTIQLAPSNMKDEAKLNRQQKLLQRLLEALFYSVSIEEVKDSALELIKDLTEHFTLIYLSRAVVEKQKRERSFSINDNEGTVYLDEKVILDAITYALSFYMKDVRNAGILALTTIFKTSLSLCGNDMDKVVQFPLLSAMFNKFAHTCYDEAYFNKLGGCLGLRVMVNDLGLPISWFQERQFELIRALFYVLRDTPSDAPCEVRNTAKELSIKILRECNKKDTTTSVDIEVVKDDKISEVTDKVEESEAPVAASEDAEMSEAIDEDKADDEEKEEEDIDIKLEDAAVKEEENEESSDIKEEEVSTIKEESLSNDDDKKDLLEDEPDKVEEEKKEGEEENDEYKREGDKKEKAFRTLVGALVYDLANANPVVRETSQEALKTLSESTGVSVTALIEPSKQVLLTPIFGKPLRALPFPMQIGNIDAITFCLGLENSFLQFNDELTRLLLEALALVDAEDESLTTAHRIFEHRTSKQLVELRVVCIKLLSLALTKPDFSAAQHGQIRIRILGVFFKTLCARSTEIINASHQGLKHVLEQNAKLPKELLQTGLRPMLMNLSDHKKLTVSGLEALARLLELLISYFKVEIGRKLLDHLMAWASVNTLNKISGQELDNNPTVQIIIAILNIFHLLPAKAYTFMEEIMSTLEYLEDNLHRRQSSPFRAPVAKFLNRFPSECFQYFLLKFNDRQMGSRFAYFVDLKECKQIRDHVIEHVDELYNSAKDEPNPEIQCIKFANLIDVVTCLTHHDKEWFKEQKKLLVDMGTIIESVVGYEKRAPLVSAVHFQVRQSIMKIQSLFVDYFEVSTLAKSDCSDTVVEFLKLICTLNISLSAELEDYVFGQIVSSDNYEARAGYLSKTINLVSGNNCSLRTRIFFLKNVFNSILIYEGQTKGNFDGFIEGSPSTASFLQDVHHKIWRSTSDIIQDHSAGSVDSYRFELLQMTAVFIKWAPNSITDVRKDVIKFSWNYIKLEDSITKQAAYVVTSYFIAAYETPVKIVSQVFFALLRSNQNESRYLVRQALDLLAPVMTERMGGNMSWLRYPRRVISEDGFNVTQVLNVYQFIVHHSDLFFIARDQFIPNIITAMGKLTILANSALENQVLAIDLAELILKWEKRAKEDGSGDHVIASPEIHKLENNVETTSPADSSHDINTLPGYSIPYGQREACVTFLVRYVCVNATRASETELGQRALGILYEFLGPNYWSEVVLKLSFFERFLLAPDFKDTSLLVYCLNSLEVLGVAIEWKSREWVISNLGYLEKLLEKCVKSDNPAIQEALQRVLRIILEAINTYQKGSSVPASSGNGGADGDEDEDENDEIKNFLTLLTNVVSEDLAGTSSVAAGVTLCWTLANYKPSTLDSLLPLIMRTFGKLCKDHIAIAHNQGGSPAATADGSASTAVNGSSNGSATTASSGTTAVSSNSTEYEAKMTTKLLEKILNLSASRISNLGDQRRVFLSLLAQLIERSPDKDILRKIIGIVRGWVFSKTDLFPTTKEKAAILGKMMSFEMRGEPALSKEFYQIIVDIFEDKSFAASELTVRMEQPFLVGTRLADVFVREKLMTILNGSLDKDINKRLYYVINEQNWEYLGDYPWLNQALQLLYGSFDYDAKVELVKEEFRICPLDEMTEGLADVDDEDDADDEDAMMVDASDKLDEIAEEIEEVDSLNAILIRNQKFLEKIKNLSAKDIFEPLVDLLYQSADTIHSAWLNLFPIAYKSIPKSEQMDFIRSLIALLSKDYHIRQADVRPNIIISILEAIGKCEEVQLPPHLVKYLGYNYNAWYPAIKILEDIQNSPNTENNKVREVNQDALIEMYSTLQEDDMFYGAWRRRAKYFETNAALSFEQVGLWDKAIQLYETAQVKARSGALPYGESEYCLWEDNWVLCAEKLQHWDVLTELSKHEGFTDLLLECGWRVADWIVDREALETSVKAVMDVPTPRRQMFETFLTLQGFGQQKQSIQDLSKSCDEGIQLALRKWNGLPKRPSAAHIPLLHTFQQYVEFMEASQIYGSLSTTTAQNLDVKSQELKRVLQVWRERLPNTWDDINIWNDLVTWRQHSFGMINKVYMPFIPALQQANGTSNANSYAYRGYHEIAWVINRFAHVARKHNMAEVCINQLTKIYTLPNIEIQEAFLKLREQAKCHYQNSNELNTGLDVISNTNLVYFATQQKAEFFTLKGMFLSKLNAQEEANQAFATSVQIDLNLPKAWAEWGLFNDKRFKEHPTEMVYANNAISCYLQAAGLYKNGKTRKLLSRILWLISLDDASGTLAQAFDSYRGEVPVWYWITFIPQLLTSLSHKEARLVRSVLIRIAKSYPQALHFQLRTTKEDFAVIQRQAMSAVRQQQTGGANASQGGNVASASGATPIASGVESPVIGGTATTVPTTGSPSNSGSNGTAASNAASGANNGTSGASGVRQPWEYVEEIMGILKTAYPLLALSLESLVDQISQRFKCTADEDAYRLAIALLNDGVQYLNRLGNPKEDAKLPPSTEANITRFAETVLPKHIRSEFEKDLVLSKPNLESYIQRLRKWRDRLEDKLDRRFNKIHLETLCPHLSEFHHQKFEDIEVPGQYLLNKDNNNHFIKVDRFLPNLDLVRGTSACYKRLTVRGHDGSLHPFAVQFPAARHCRREERIFQLFRIFNDALSRKVQSRRRNIQLTLPIAIPLSPHIRIMNDDERDITMQSVYEHYCREKGQNRDEPFIYSIQKLRAAFDPRLSKPDLISIKVEILSAIQSTLVPSTVFRDYFMRLYPHFEDFWLFRKQFTSQYASFIFMTYMMCINSRQAQKIHINQGSGNVWTSEILPCKIASGRTHSTAYNNSTLDASSQRSAPLFHNAEPVPFRLTPNIQKLIGEAGLEGILSVYISIISRCLSEPEFDLEQYLSLFVRDEVISWYAQQHRPSAQDPQLKEIVRVNVDLVVRRVLQLGQISSAPSIASQFVLELISQAVNPRNLAGADSLWMAYL